MESYIDIKGKFTEEELLNIKECIYNLLSTYAGTQPMDREFGINFNELDQPMNNATMNRLSLELIEKIERYEPRVTVEEIEIETDLDGAIFPKIILRKAEEEEDG